MYSLKQIFSGRVSPLLKSSAIMLGMATLTFAAGTAADIFAPGTGVCKILSLLPYGGVVAMTVGGTMAGINYMSHDQESKQKAKVGIEGLLIGGAVLLVLPSVIGFFMNVTVCAA